MTSLVLSLVSAENSVLVWRSDHGSHLRPNLIRAIQSSLHPLSQNY